MKNNEFYSLLQHEYSTSFSGWDFSYLIDSGRMEEFPVSWNYPSIVNRAIEKSVSMLDMGTGGGEFLDSLPKLPLQTFATEGYLPNIEIAQKRLKNKKIIVKPIKEDDQIPFDDNSFDLVINRHESYRPEEVSRVLKNDGKFISQQVGGLNDIDLNMVLGAETSYSDWSLSKAIIQLEKVMFSINEFSEDIVKTRFYDIGAIVYYLKCISWQVEDFFIDKYIDRLELLNRLISKNGYIDFICHRFFFIASK